MEDQLGVSNMYLMGVSKIYLREEPQREHWGNGINFSKIKDIQESSD